MQKASLKILALAVFAALGSAHAYAGTTLSTQNGNDQIFGIGANGSTTEKTVGDWGYNLFTIMTPVNVQSNLSVGFPSKPGAAYTLNINGSANATAYYHNSDARLKTDIHPIDNALDKILALHGVEFNWKKDGRADMGVVAQNVAQVFPNVVAKNEQGMMAVEYDSLVGPMIEAMRDLKAQNDELRTEVKEIRASMKELKKENTRLHSVKVDSDTVQQPVTLNP